jgi:hypothetical protein
VLAAGVVPKQRYKTTWLPYALSSLSVYAFGEAGAEPAFVFAEEFEFGRGITITKRDRIRAIKHHMSR